MEQPATIGGGSWSAKDLFGHVAAWEEIALQTIGVWRAGQPRPTDGDWQGTDAFNARVQQRMGIAIMTEKLPSIKPLRRDDCAVAGRGEVLLDRSTLNERSGSRPWLLAGAVPANLAIMGWTEAHLVPAAGRASRFVRWLLSDSACGR